MKNSLISTEVAEPYAEALMSVAQSQNKTEDFGNDLRSLLGLLEASPELEGFLINPLPKPEDKKAVLRRIVGESNPVLINFLMLLVDRRRIMYIRAIAQQYLQRLRKLNNTVLAEVVSAVELSEAQRNTVSDKIKSLTSANQVELKTSVDPDLIGGVIIKVGSQVFDASIRGQLRRIGISLASS